jgi:hypothetical protein
VLGTLSLVQAGLIAFEVIPLKPYPGLARLFADATSPDSSNGIVMVLGLTQFVRRMM